MGAPIVANLRSPKMLAWAFASAVVLFDVQFFLMRTLPGGAHEFVCEAGGALTLSNVSFAVLFSVLVGVMVAGFIAQYGNAAQKRKLTAASSVTGIGAIIGTLTLFCTVCAIPVVSLFGASTLLSLFVNYNLTFKLVSVAMLCTGLYLMNRQLQNKCVSC